MKAVAAGAPAAGRPIGDDDLQAWVDGRLAPDRREAVAAWLDAHADAAARVRAQAEQREALRARLAPKLAEPVPARLRVRNVVARRRRAQRATSLRVAASVALLALGTASGWAGRGALDGMGAAPVLAVGGAGSPASVRRAGLEVTADAVLAHRVFAVERLHPVEVRAEEGAHLVRWLSNRLGRRLEAPDLAPLGFRLMGGRLLPGDGPGPAAQLMYDDDAGTRLTVYLRAAGADGTTEFRFAEADGVAAFSWVDRGFGYAVSAGTDRGRLLRVAEAVHAQLAEGGGAG